jgi:Skp1 family, tetramerisation domain
MQSDTVVSNTGMEDTIMGLDGETKSTITLVSNDQEIFVVERTVAAQSELVKTMMEGGVLS